jgi:predicted pyridoxine 5'-phosphate oxidase superfamily flavin-nucleotide-binding protein
VTTFYSDNHRALQDEFASRGLADRLESMIVQPAFDAPAQDFVEAADFFFLSSVDHEGFPTVSHKGGDPGFVKVAGPSTLLFPCYDGNGMYYSMGNIDGHPQVGLLFMSFDRPHRVRIQGNAKLIREPDILNLWPETAIAVRVDITNMWINCPRYIHRSKRVEASEFVPRPGVETPQAEWKSLDVIADVVPPPAHTLDKQN